MSKLKPMSFTNGPDANLEGIYMYYCPGCKSHHVVHTQDPRPDNGAKWVLTGDEDIPTIRPSIHVGVGSNHTCHHWITDGMLSYLPDSTHPLSGSTIQMEDVN